MLGKPGKGQRVESMLLQMAQRGQIMGRLGENELIGILEQVSEQMQTKTTVKVCLIYRYSIKVCCLVYLFVLELLSNQGTIKII